MTEEGVYELRYDISEHNAGRSCEICRDPAVVYYWIEGELSTFRCSEHRHEDDRETRTS